MSFTTRSSSPVRGRGIRAGLSLAAAALTLVALVGCTPDPGPTPTKSASPTDAPTTAPVDTPTPTPTPEAAGTAVAIGCDQLLTLDDLYQYNPNFGNDPGYAPADGSAAQTATKYSGIACAWVNLTSKDVIELSVAQPNEVLMADLTNAAISKSEPVPTYGAPPISGFFSKSAGQAQVFTGPYWVVATSSAFIEPGDAEQLLTAAISHLP